jgi:hypothetical protein
MSKEKTHKVFTLACAMTHTAGSRCKRYSDFSETDPVPIFRMQLMILEPCCPVHIQYRYPVGTRDGMRTSPVSVRVSPCRCRLTVKILLNLVIATASRHILYLHVRACQIDDHIKPAGNKRRSILISPQNSFKHTAPIHRKTYQTQGGSNMTGTDLCVNKPHKSRSYLNHLVHHV